MSRLSQGQSPLSIFAVPAFLAVATLLGLGLGLAGDREWDIATWLLLGLSPAAFFLAWFTRKT